MNIWIAGLALVLASLSSRATQVWASPETLWSNANQVSPNAPRPLVNLASRAMDQGKDAQGELLLGIAQRVALGRSVRERQWTDDLVQANLALIRIRQGRFTDARSLVMGGPPDSARWLVCQAVKGLCAA